DALVNGVDDLLFIDQVRQRLTHLLVGQDRIGAIQVDVGVASRGSAVDLQPGSGLHPRNVLRRDRRLHEIEVAALEADDATGVVGNNFYPYTIEVRSSAKEAVVGRQLDGVAGRPAVELERAGTDGLRAKVRAELLYGRLRHDGQVHVGQ